MVEKRQPGLGSQNASKKEEKKRKKEKREADILCDTSAHEQKCSFASTNRPEEEARQSFKREREKTFLFFYDAEKGKRKTKESARVRFLFFLEREREERDSFVVVVSLTSFTSSSPGHHP